MRYEDLTSVERRLVDAVLGGYRFDLSNDARITAVAMVGWGEERVVRANLIREMLSGAFDWPDNRHPDPLGIRLRGARLEGRLFLTDVDADLPLVMLDCITTEPIVLVRAHLPMMLITRLVAPAVNASSVRIDHDLKLDEGQLGALVMDRAEVGGKLDLSETRVHNENGAALRAANLHVGSDLNLHRFQATGTSADGAVDIRGAVVDGFIDLKDAKIDNPSGPALYAQMLRCRGYVSLGGGFYARGAGDQGSVNLIGTEIGGQLNLSNATLINATGPSVAADNLDAKSDVIFHGTRGDGGGALGTVRLVNAKVGGVLDLSGAHFVNPNGPAVRIEHVNVATDVLLGDGFRASGRGGTATVSALSAKIGEQLRFTGAQVINESGSAVAVDGLRTGSQVLFDGGFHAEGNGELGAVRIVGADIGGTLGFIGAYLANSDGPALNAYGASVADDVVFRENFRAQGNSQAGAVQMGAARVGKDLCFSESRIRSFGPAHPALNLERTHVSGYLWLPASTACQSELVGPAEVNTEWIADGKIEFDGLTYQGLPRKADLHEWLTMLQERTTAYAAQPYRQLAAAHLEAGREEDVREIRIAQQDDILHRGELGWRGKLWQLVKRHTIRYGYQPSRAVMWLLITLLLSLGVVFLAGSFGLVVHPPGDSNTGARCSIIEQVGFVLDRSVPILRIDGQQRCQISPTGGWAAAVTIAIWILRILGWVFATLFVVGLTSLIRGRSSR